MKTNKYPVLIIVVFLIASASGTLKNFEDYANTFLSRVESVYISELIKNLTSENIFLGDYIDHGGYGAVVHGTYNVDNISLPIAIKVMYVDDQEECNQAEIINTLTQYKAKYILKMYFRKYYELGPFRRPKHRFCVLGLELGVQALSDPIFSKSYNFSSNTQEFIEIVFKIIRGFKSMNFDAGYTHGDIKPSNIILVNNNGILEPRIIDFDLTFQPKVFTNKYGKHGPNRVIYTVIYRPPEMLVFCPDNDCDGLEGEEYADLRFKFFMMYYEFSPQSKEDAFALGLSLKHILETNMSRINPSHPLVHDIEKWIIPGLMLGDPTKRWSTENAYAELGKKIQELKFQFRETPRDQIAPKFKLPEIDHNFGKVKTQADEYGTIQPPPNLVLAESKDNYTTEYANNIYLNPGTKAEFPYNQDSIPVKKPLYKPIEYPPVRNVDRDYNARLSHVDQLPFILKTNRASEIFNQAKNTRGSVHEMNRGQNAGMYPEGETSMFEDAQIYDKKKELLRGVRAASNNKAALGVVKKNIFDNTATIVTRAAQKMLHDKI